MTADTVTTQTEKDAWEAAAEHAKANSGGKFISMKAEGDHCCIAIIGDPAIVHSVWANNKRYDAHTAEGKALLAQGLKEKTTYDLNVLDLENGCARKSLSLDGKTIQQLKELRLKFPQTKWSYRITRLGVAFLTAYQVLPDAELTMDQRELMLKKDDELPF